VAAKHAFAWLLSRKGRYQEANELFAGVLAQRERTLGADHPGTLATLNSLAGVLARKGDLAEAERMYLEVLSARERTLGPDYPDIIPTLLRLGSLISAQERSAEAKVFLRRAAAAFERTLAPEHPDGLLKRGRQLESEGATEDAEALYRFALSTQSRALGPAHAWTLACANRLASLLFRRGKVEEAQRRLIYLRGARLSQPRLDPLHPPDQELHVDVPAVRFPSPFSGRFGHILTDRRIERLPLQRVTPWSKRLEIRRAQELQRLAEARAEASVDIPVVEVIEDHVRSPCAAIPLCEAKRDSRPTSTGRGSRSSSPGC
jgi:tetratricopeptide (TPR) repeat protein